MLTNNQLYLGSENMSKWHFRRSYIPTESTSQREQAFWQYFIMKAEFVSQSPINDQYIQSMSSPYAFTQSTHIHRLLSHTMQRRTCTVGYITRVDPT